VAMALYTSLAGASIPTRCRISYISLAPCWGGFVMCN
jgi:hypothetical protein